MVILIGGRSSSGKTKLANTLMKSLGIPYIAVLSGLCSWPRLLVRRFSVLGSWFCCDCYISVDHLMIGIYRSNSDCEFTPMSDVSTINHHIWPIVREMIKTNIDNIRYHRSAIELRCDIDGSHTMTKKSAELIDDFIANSANYRLVRSVYEEEIQAIAQEISSAFALNLPRQER